MENIKILAFCLVCFAVFSCGGSKDEDGKEVELPYNAKLGIGKYSTLSISAEIDSLLVKTGDELYMQKCASCHDLSDKIIVGPGWQDITKRRELVWLMNLMTNTEEMLEKDPELKKQIVKFKSQMPDFGLTEKEARAILEFMRKNDKGEIQRERDLPSACKHIGRN
jgi:mono/diheme cytochrome c family protein